MNEKGIKRVTSVFNYMSHEIPKLFIKQQLVFGLADVISQEVEDMPIKFYEPEMMDARYSDMMSQRAEAILISEDRLKELLAKEEIADRYTSQVVIPDNACVGYREVKYEKYRKVMETTISGQELSYKPVKVLSETEYSGKIDVVYITKNDYFGIDEVFIYDNYDDLVNGR